MSRDEDVIHIVVRKELMHYLCLLLRKLFSDLRDYRNFDICFYKNIPTFTKSWFLYFSNAIIRRCQVPMRYKSEIFESEVFGT